MSTQKQLSEFSKYDQSIITECVREYAKKTAETPDSLLFYVIDRFAEKYVKFNSKYVKRSKDSSPEKTKYEIVNPYKYLDKYKKTPLPTANGTKLSKCIGDLINAYDTLIEEYNRAKQDGTNKIDLKHAKKCVNSYYSLVKKTVFFSKNPGLRNDHFRKSDYLRDIVLPQREYYAINSEDGEGLDLGFDVSFIDACNLDVILLILNNLKLLKASIKVNDSLKDLKISLFCSMAERCFGRYARLGDESYRITLNRQTSKIVARPFGGKSSLLAIKPIRLFEKIKAFLRNYINDYEEKNLGSTDNKFKFIISIIGHCEQSWLSENPQEVEVNDLCIAISQWLADECSNLKYSVQLDYYINEADWFLCSGKRRNNEEISTCYKDKNISCSIIKFSYRDKFLLFFDEIEKIINKSEMTFFLDPAFLYTENYIIGKKYPIEYYCDILREKAIGPQSDNTNNIRLDLTEKCNDNQTNIMFMNTQLNRIMGSKTREAGNICRIFRNDIVQSIKNSLKSTKKDSKSTVYIYSSETIGVSESDEYFHPFVRLEQYNGKAVNIFQYCNYQVPRLNQEPSLMGNGDSNDIISEFKISFWSTLKYISLNYAYLYAKEWIDNAVKKANNKLKLEPCDYLLILKNIYTVICIKTNKNGKYIIDCSVKLEKQSKNSIFKKYQKEESDKIFEEIFQSAQDIILPLFETIIFKEETNFASNFGNELIKGGFGMNIYSLAKTADDIYFWFNYNNALKTNDFRKFTFVSKKSNTAVYLEENKTQFEPKGDLCFMDKRIYSIMLNQLNKWDTTNFAFDRLNDKVKSENFYYKTNNNENENENEDESRLIPQALKKACERLGDVNLPLYNRIIEWIED